MTSQRLSPEDLIVLGRRGKLSADQAEAFQRLMRTDPEAVDLHRMGRAFDRTDPVQPGDEALVGRAVEAALRQRQQRRSGSKRVFGSRRLGPWLIAAMVMGSAASALGLAKLYVSLATPNSTESAAPATSVLDRSRAVKTQRRSNAAPRVVNGQKPAPPAEPQGEALEEAAIPVESEPSVAAIENEPSAAFVPSEQKATAAAPNSALATAREAVPRASASGAEPRAASNGSRSTSASETHSDVPTAAFAEDAPAPTAAGLFESANQARRQGNLALCIRQYRSLQSQFASSAEAQLSHVSLGKVLQATGDFASAIVEFSVYLKRPGSLEEEAIVGRAESLARMGRTAEEAADWQRLLTRNRNSVYAGRANARLSAIRAQNAN